jgi:hypothetical protein
MVADVGFADHAENTPGCVQAQRRLLRNAVGPLELAVPRLHVCGVMMAPPIWVGIASKVSAAGSRSDCRVKWGDHCGLRPADLTGEAE